MHDPRDPMMERLLDDAGLAAGMAVLDLGCGSGNVTSLIARRVGPAGRVVGLDRSGPAVAAAAERFGDQPNVTVAVADLTTFAGGFGPFDAIVTRRVLMYLADPADVLRRAVASLRPGGLVVAQENDATMTPASHAPLPLHARVHDWMWQTVEREGGNRHMGFDLRGVLRAAGLVDVQVRAEAVVQTPETDHPTAAIVRAMLPRMEQHGVTTAAAVDIDTLADRLAAERAGADATYIGDMVFGAHGRRPQ